MIMKSDETKKVLVVGNDQQTRHWLSGWFQDKGYDPVEVKDVELVKTQVCENTRLVVSAIDGPSSDTDRLIQIVKSVSAVLPVILVSAPDLVDSAVRCMQSGGTDYLLKPISPAELSVKVDRALRERQLHEELASLRATKSSSSFVDGMTNGKQEVKTLQKIEREAIVEALDGFGGARGKTAKALGISVRTLQRKIKEYGYINVGDRANSSFPTVNQPNTLHN